MMTTEQRPYRLGISLACGGFGICALDIEGDDRLLGMRGMSVHLSNQPLPGHQDTGNTTDGGLAELLTEVVAEQGDPREVLMSSTGGTNIDTSPLMEILGSGTLMSQVSGPELASALQEWRLIRPGAPESRHFSPRRTALQAFGTAVVRRSPAAPEARSLRRSLPAQLNRLVTMARPTGAAGPVRRHLEIFELPDGRWGTAGGTNTVMRLFEDDLLMVGGDDDNRILRVVRWGSRSGVLWLAPSSEPGDLRKRHHDPDDPLRCQFVPVGRLKAMGARQVSVDRIGRVRDMAAIQTG